MAVRVWFLVHEKGIVLRQEDGRLSLPSDDDVAALGATHDAAHAMGTFADREAVAFALASSVVLPPHLVVAGLRSIFSDLGEDTFLLAGRATQLVEWATTHRFCGRCGTATERVPTERCMRCPACGLTAYPRIAPAVIVLVRKGDEALLARGARFPASFYSTLAGFVEVGESLEETVAREIEEEVGVRVKNVRYFGSQPWPFPHSLMVGFTAEWASGELKPDGAEILEAAWFRATDLPPVPPPISIARRLIDAWVDEVTRR
jgi:NAD+ diphosphatase